MNTNDNAANLRELGNDIHRLIDLREGIAREIADCRAQPGKTPGGVRIACGIWRMNTTGFSNESSTSIGREGIWRGIKQALTEGEFR